MVTTTKVASVGTKIFLGSHQASCLWEPNYLEVHTVRGFKYCRIMTLVNSSSPRLHRTCHLKLPLTRRSRSICCQHITSLGLSQDFHDLPLPLRFPTQDGLLHPQTACSIHAKDRCDYEDEGYEQGGILDRPTTNYDDAQHGRLVAN